MPRYVFVAERSQVWIEGRSSVHPVNATATGLAGWIDVPARGAKITGRVEIPVERLRSGNPLVDAETRRRIDARRYPLITGEVRSATRAAAGTYDLRGVLSFRGEAVEVDGTIRVAPSGAGIVVEGEQVLDVRSWGLEPPRLLTLRVHPDIRVRIRLEAEPDPA